jgi:DNA-binding transcriptional LysR family regulator
MDLNVLSPKTWRLSDLGAKHAFLRAGLGWGSMPLDVIEADLASGALIPLALEDIDTNIRMAMSVIYRADSPPGPAGRWLIDRLKRASGDARITDGSSPGL